MIGFKLGPDTIGKGIVYIYIDRWQLLGRDCVRLRNFPCAYKITINKQIK